MQHFVSVEGRTLAKAMRPAIDTIKRRNSIPILNHIRLTLSAEGLRLDATDLDNHVETRIDVIDGAGEWSVCLPAKLVNQIARVAGVMPVSIEPQENENAIVRIGDHPSIASYTLHTLPSSDYPEWDKPRGDLIETFTNGMFAEAIGKVSRVISTEETRYYLNGVCWQIGPNGRRFAATDGHRLLISLYDKSGDDEVKPASRIIPRKTVSLISKHMTGKDVKAFGLGTSMEIASPDLTIRAKLIDGSFPDVDRVIPAIGPQTFSITMNRTEIIAAIEQAQVIASDSGRAVKFINDNGKARIEVRNPDFGDAVVATSSAWPAKPAASAALDAFAFNGSYIKGMLDMCQGDVTLSLDSGSSPARLSDRDETMTRVLMPMRA